MAQDKTAALVITLDKEIKTIKELKQYIEELSVAVSQTAEGTEQYERGMEKLTTAQKELEKATSLVKGQTSSAKDSYYALNKQLAESRKAYKNLSEAERNNTEVGGALLKSISELDSQLKDMDATMGQFQRNVGNYEIAGKAMANQAHDLADAFKASALQGTALGKATDSLDKTTKLFTKNPIMGMITLLLPLLLKVVEAVKQNDTAMEALNKIMASMQPIMDMCAVVIEKLAQVFAKLADKVAKLISKLFKSSGGGGERGDNLESATEAVSDSMSKMKDTTKEATEAIDEQRVALDALAESAKNADKIISDHEKKRQESLKAWQELMKETEGVVGELDADMEGEIADLLNTTQSELAEGLTAPWLKDIEAMEERRKALGEAYNATLSIMGAIADIYEANADEDEKAAKKAKAIRIASTIIETLSGATAAYMNSVKAYKSNPALGIAMGALNAAVVTAAGMANIAKMKSTTASSTSAVSATTATSAVSAPSVSRAEIPTAVVTGASQSSVNTRAYIVWSDLEGAMGQASGTESETSW